MDDLLCPACRVALTRTLTPLGVIWRCETCEGRAIGLALLRETFTADSVNPIWLHAIHNEGRDGRPCPSCARAMIDVPLETETPVNVEVCRVCQMIWFDQGEVASLEQKAIRPELPPLSQDAREAIAIAKVHLLGEQARKADLADEPANEFWRVICWLFSDL